jgi:hypothetical protein
VFPLIGVILGHLALQQIKRTGQEGRGLAIAGLVIGYAAIALTLLIAAVVLMIILTQLYSVSAGVLPYHASTSGGA